MPSALQGIRRSIYGSLAGDRGFRAGLRRDARAVRNSLTVSCLMDAFKWYSNPLRSQLVWPSVPNEVYTLIDGDTPAAKLYDGCIIFRDGSASVRPISGTSGTMP